MIYQSSAESKIKKTSNVCIFKPVFPDIRDADFPLVDSLLPMNVLLNSCSIPWTWKGFLRLSSDVLPPFKSLFLLISLDMLWNFLGIGWTFPEKTRLFVIIGGRGVVAIEISKMRFNWLKRYYLKQLLITDAYTAFHFLKLSV